MSKQTAVHKRLADSKDRLADWKKWGPYIAERAWGTVREDYSANGDAWNYLPHDHARSRAYRWNEDGLGAICNRFQNICLGLALWNEHDPILKERLFGLNNSEGNHGEDVKEYYFYLDNIPCHTYMKMLYKYPQVEYPYDALVHHGRGRQDKELELIDAIPQVFAENRYFDVFIEYAKVTDEDILCRITAINRGPEAAPLHLLPHIWYRNTWSWGYNDERPTLEAIGSGAIAGKHRHIGNRWWYAQSNGENLGLMFTENDTNMQRLFGQPNKQPYVKDAFHNAVIERRADMVNPKQVGTKAAAHFHKILQPGETFTVQIRFTNAEQKRPFAKFDAVFAQRIEEADEFYAHIQDTKLTDDERQVQRQAFAGLLWNKQFYHYSVELWLAGDPATPPPPESRKHGRNADWDHLYNVDVISMPDKWEYPWYASWDLAFHTLPIAMIDPDWAKRQLILLLREWYMHPNGQIPAYEWKFEDVNPPVHAWAVWRVYKIARNASGYADTEFLERCFQKLLLNFTWWVNRKDEEGKNVFQGGFLGLDNIGVFDRSSPLPNGAFIQQADGTAWMGMYCLNMLAIALELARTRPAYEDVATKFFEHFIYIANAMHDLGGDFGLWDAEDGFFYDGVRFPDGQYVPLRTRSFVGLIPLFAVETLEPDLLEKLPQFARRVEWFTKYRPDLVKRIASLTKPGVNGRFLLSIINHDQLLKVLSRMLDTSEFLSDYGLRSVSKYHSDNPYTWKLDGNDLALAYEPGESSTGLFGGNSNWRGPIWFPVNYLMIESLQKYHHYYGDSIRVDMPTGSGKHASLHRVAAELSQRLCSIFLRNSDNERAVFGGSTYFQSDAYWKDHIPFFEYFHGDNGTGLGASHQTGWTALVAKLIQQSMGD
ncbi:MAG: glucosidase [Anaerolineaceae bacterium]|nr:glucosidase [Anaerolineaceae bacterium]